MIYFQFLQHKSASAKLILIDHHPVSNVLDHGHITLLSPGTENYTGMSKKNLVVRAKVTKASATDLDPDNKVRPVNNFLHCRFKQAGNPSYWNLHILCLP